MPIGIATTLPLIPINLLKKLDTVIRPKDELLTLVDAGVTTKLVSIQRTEHQTTSLMNFPSEGWSMQDEVITPVFRSTEETLSSFRRMGKFAATYPTTRN